MKQYQGIITEFGSLHEAIKQFKIKNKFNFLKNL